MNSRRKGACGERSAAAYLNSLLGFTARRAQQHSGTETSADLIVPETPLLWWEVKRVQKLNIPQAMEKAGEQCGERVPVLMHRRNGGEWLLTLRLRDAEAVASSLGRRE